MLRLLVFVLCLNIAGICFGQQVIANFSEENIAVLNEELRQLRVGNIKVDGVTIDKVSGRVQLILAPVSAGGLGEDFSATTKGSLLWFEGTGNVGTIPTATPDTGLFQGNNDIYWRAFPIKLKSTTAASGTNSGEISISSDKRYFVWFEGVTATATADIIIRINGDITANSYQYRIDKRYFSATADATVKSENATEILIADNADVGARLKAQFFIDTTERNDFHIWINGTMQYRDSSNLYADFAGLWEIDSSITSFNIYSDVGSYVGNIYLYELLQ